jgi:DNA-binding CsgD family transcriptional regulator
VSEPGPRVAAWLGTISDLLGEPLYEMPHHVIFDQLHQTFGVNAVAANRADPEGRQLMITSPSDALQSVTDLEEWTQGDSRNDNPLVRWYATTGDPRPMTIGRVPTSISPMRDRARIVASLRQQELEEQLSITYRLSGQSFHAFVLGRSSSDFSDDDVILAEYVQKALIALDKHITLMRELAQMRGLARDVELTGREMTVLGLLTAGHSRRTIGRRLGCSLRTVDKHLERIYRKLGVRDKLNAVRAAQLWGLATSGFPEEGRRGSSGQ